MKMVGGGRSAWCRLKGGWQTTIAGAADFQIWSDPAGESMLLPLSSSFCYSVRMPPRTWPTWWYGIWLLALFWSFNLSWPRVWFVSSLRAIGDFASDGTHILVIWAS
jgi:hypothetical protein